MARNVEAGSTWARELGIWPPEFALPQPDTNTV
jgi:hypothetical protein